MLVVGLLELRSCVGRMRQLVGGCCVCCFVCTLAVSSCLNAALTLLLLLCEMVDGGQRQAAVQARTLSQPSAFCLLLLSCNGSLVNYN